MSAKFGVFVPQGWRMDLVEIDDPIEQYEAMTNVGKAAEKAGYDSIWVFDHSIPYRRRKSRPASRRGRSRRGWHGIPARSRSARW